LTVVQECRAVVNVIVESVVTGKTFSAQIFVVEQIHVAFFAFDQSTKERNYSKQPHPTPLCL
jgi:hypothetical protein